MDMMGWENISWSVQTTHVCSQVQRPVNYNFLKNYLSVFAGDLPTKLETQVRDWDLYVFVPNI